MTDAGTFYHSVMKDYDEAQSAQHDMRERSRDADHFVNKPGGQWETAVWRDATGKPRYTFDRVSGIISDIMGEMSTMEFASRVRPEGNGATKDVALVYDGLLRSIENTSPIKAKYTYRSAGRQMVTTGIGGWRVDAGFKTPKSMYQSLMISPVSTFMDRVWFAPGYQLQDASDADYAFLLTTMDPKSYAKTFPDGSNISVGRDEACSAYEYKIEDSVTVGEYFYKQTKKVDLVQMSDGAVYTVDEDFLSVRDELWAKGITVQGERETDMISVKHRVFDGADWLTGAEDTVFSLIPIVQAVANFEITEDGKQIHYGVVEKMMDAQRVLNYSESRKVEEGALAPRSKIAATDEQIDGYESNYETMNTNLDPHLPYNHVEGQEKPYRIAGAEINPGLAETTQAMERHIQSISQNLDASRADRLGLQSGVALERVENKQNVGNFEYFFAMEVAVNYGCRVMRDAIPLVYDTKREIRLEEQDGTSKTATIHTRTYDEDKGTLVSLNDLSLGDYGVTTSAGPAFQNKQQETVETILEVAKIYPPALDEGADVLLANITSPGMDKLATRVRAKMVSAGKIPEEELTDEEKKVVKALMENPPAPAPAEQAMLDAAQAELQKSQAMTQDIISKSEDREKMFMLKIEELKLKNEQTQSKMQNDNQKMILEVMQAQDEQLKTMAETLKAIKEATGVDTIVAPNSARAYNNQAGRLADAVSTAE